MTQTKKDAHGAVPVRLLIDTCVWLDIAKDYKDQTLIGAIEDLCAAGEIELLLPRIVVDEFARHKAKIAEEGGRSLAGSLKRAREALYKFGDPKKRRRALDEIDDAEHRISRLGDLAVGGIGKIEKLFSTTVITETSDAIRLRASERAIDKRAPFHNGRNNFADAVLIEMYGEAAQGSGRYAFVTHNKRDFSYPNKNEKLPHPDIASYFSKIKSRYFIKLGDALKTERPMHFAEAMELYEFSTEPRRATEISDAIGELLDKIWYDRHMVTRYKIQTGKIKVVPKKDYAPKNYQERERMISSDILAGALRSAKKVERKYGKNNLGPYSKFDWGMMNGKLSALRWVFGDEWDMLDN